MTIDDALPRPSLRELCGRRQCDHPFGLHWESYNGKQTGCASSSYDQYDGFSRCPCEGFAVVRVWGPGGSQRGDV